MGDMADYATEQGELALRLHENDECGAFGPCQYCEEETKERAKVKIDRIDGFSEEKGSPTYWLDAVRDFWAEMDMDTDEIELRFIVKWFDERRKKNESEA